jgi:hypothetical protein
VKPAEEQLAKGQEATAAGVSGGSRVNAAGAAAFGSSAAASSIAKAVNGRGSIEEQQLKAMVDLKTATVKSNTLLAQLVKAPKIEVKEES